MVYAVLVNVAPSSPRRAPPRPTLAMLVVALLGAHAHGVWPSA